MDQIVNLPKTESDSAIETALGLDRQGLRKTRRRGWLYAVLTLIVLPVYYELFDDLSEWAKRMWFMSSPAATDPEPSPAAGD